MWMTLGEALESELVRQLIGNESGCNPPLNAGEFAGGDASEPVGLLAPALAREGMTVTANNGSPNPVAVIPFRVVIGGAPAQGGVWPGRIRRNALGGNKGGELGWVVIEGGGGHSKMTSAKSSSRRMDRS